MNIGAANEQALSSNRRDFNQAQLQIAGLEQQNMLRKNEEAQNYWANRRQESNQAISSNLSALGSAVGSGLSMGAMNQQTKALQGLGDMFNAAPKQLNAFDAFLKSRPLIDKSLFPKTSLKKQ